MLAKVNAEIWKHGGIAATKTDGAKNSQLNKEVVKKPSIYYIDRKTTREHAQNVRTNPSLYRKTLQYSTVGHS